MQTTQNGLQKPTSEDFITAYNSNADILDEHIGEAATSDNLGHIKIGDGLQSEDGTTSVKIANDLKTNDASTVLSAARGVELNKNIEAINDILNKIYVRSNTIDVLDSSNPSIFVAAVGSTNLPNLDGNACMCLHMGTGTQYDAVIAFSFGADKIAINRKYGNASWRGWKYVTLT